VDATEEISMRAQELIEKHQIPCGAMAVSVDGVCRRRLRDHLDALLDRLTKETHPEGADRDLLEMEEEPEIPEPPEPEETRDDKKKRLIEEGKLRAEVSKEVGKYKEKLMGNSKLLQDTSGKIKKR
jgi:hypothetical protein